MSYTLIFYNIILYKDIFYNLKFVLRPDDIEKYVVTTTYENNQEEQEQLEQEQLEQEQLEQ